MTEVTAARKELTHAVVKEGLNKSQFGVQISELSEKNLCLKIIKDRGQGCAR